MGNDATTPNDAGASKAPPPPGTPPASKPASGVRDSSLQTDITKILGEVKLPERRVVPGTPKGPGPQKQYVTTLADPTVPAPKTEPVPPPKTAIVPEEAQLMHPDRLGSLHTLKDDLQHVVQENKISYVRAVTLEEEKRHRIEERTPPKIRASKRSLFTLFVVILLVGTGALALGAVYVITNQRAVQSNAAVQSNILFAEQSVPFPIDNEAPGDVRRILASARTSNALTLGAILQIIPVHTSTDESGAVSATSITFGEFLTALGTRAPAELARALGDDFFFGIHTVDENAPVLIIPVRSYERAFAAMLEWEPFMNADLDPLFTGLSAQAMGPDGIPIAREFEDTVMRNYDVRALKDDSGTIQLYYSFPTRNVLIIAESPFSFTEVLSRLRADRRL